MPGRPLRIAQCSEYYYPDVGGIPEHMHHLGRCLADRGHDVTILTTSYRPGEAREERITLGLRVLRLGRACAPLIANGSVSRAAIGLSLGAEVAEALQREDFDVIHVHGPTFPVLPLLALRHAPPRAALVGTLHCHFEDSRMLRFFRGRLQRYLDALDAVIAVSETAVGSLQRVGLRVAAQCIPNGVDMDYWVSGRPRPELCGALNLLAQARLEPRNDLSLVIDALGRMDGPRPRLVVVGEGPSEAALRARLLALPEARRPEVHFAGARIEDRRDFAAASALYAFTARIASHPMSLLEGMAAGLAVLAHDIPGVRGLLRDGIDGLVLPLDGVDAYAAALTRLRDDAGLRRRLGQAARARAAAFAWPEVAGQIEAVYERACAGRAPAGPAAALTQAGMLQG